MKEFNAPAIKLLGHIMLHQSIILFFFQSMIIIHFLIIISTTVAHTQLKFDTWMCVMNIQTEFKFGSGSFEDLAKYGNQFHQNILFKIYYHCHINRWKVNQLTMICLNVWRINWTLMFLGELDPSSLQQCPTL